MIESREGLRPTIVEVDQAAIRNNARRMKERFRDDVELIAVVKANGYGHGSAIVAEAAIEAGASMIAVATGEEALQMRKRHQEIPILILGPVPVTFIPKAAKYRITLTIPSVDWLERAVETYRDEPITVHLKIDSGMHRIGVETIEDVKRVEFLMDQSAFSLEGAFTHFACADEIDDTMTSVQKERFETLVAALSKRPRMLHAANSAAASLYEDVTYDAIRVGFHLYGIPVAPHVAAQLPFSLERALTVRTEVTRVSLLKKGESVSYGAKYVAPKDEWVATLPIGYADGLRRALTGQDVLIRGKRQPIIGTICMDQWGVRLDEPVSPGAPVIMNGKSKTREEEVTVEEWADRLGTIPYEICTSLSPRMHRRVKQS